MIQSVFYVHVYVWGAPSTKGQRVAIVEVTPPFRTCRNFNSVGQLQQRF